MSRKIKCPLFGPSMQSLYGGVQYATHNKQLAAESNLSAFPTPETIIRWGNIRGPQRNMEEF